MEHKHPNGNTASQPSESPAPPYQPSPSVEDGYSQKTPQQPPLQPPQATYLHDQHSHPPPEGYVMQQQQPQKMVMAQAGATPISALQQTAAPVDCPSCGQRAVTIPSFETGGFTHLIALAVCCVSCLGCIPYLIDGLKDVTHKCGRCGVPIATWHRSGRTVVHVHPQ